ncbi:MAG TPA: DMT family transporter [Williamwhitmania sp.]|nr:DMT family transporter [Williamwhitmania sp.]
MNRRVFSGTIVLAIIACVLWATAFTGIKIGLRYTPPLQFAGIRFFISGLLLLPFVRQISLKFRIARKHWKQIVVVGILQITLQYALFYTGVSMVPGALGAMVVGSGPLFVTLVAHFMLKNDRLTVRKSVSIALGLLGVAIISLSRKELMVEGSLIGFGIAVLILNNGLAGIGNVVVSRTAAGLPPLVLSSFSMILGGALLYLIALPIEGFACGPFPLEYYGALAWLSFLSAAAITIWYILLNRPGVKVSDLNMWKFIIPVVGAIMSWAVLPGEKPDMYSVLGMVVIAAALLVLNLKKRNRTLAALS